MKRSLLVEGYGIPLGRVLAPANRDDSPLLGPALDKLEETRGGCGGGERRQPCDRGRGDGRRARCLGDRRHAAVGPCARRRDRRVDRGRGAADRHRGRCVRADGAAPGRGADGRAPVRRSGRHRRVGHARAGTGRGRRRADRCAGQHRRRCADLGCGSGTAGAAAGCAGLGSGDPRGRGDVLRRSGPSRRPVACSLPPGRSTTGLGWAWCWRRQRRARHRDLVGRALRPALTFLQHRRRRVGAPGGNGA